MEHLRQSYLNLSGFCNRLYFPKMVAIISPIPYVPLSMWLWHSSHQIKRWGLYVLSLSLGGPLWLPWPAEWRKWHYFLWLRLDHKNAKPVCFVLLENSLWRKPAVMTVLKLPCCEEAQAHLHGEIVWRSPETKWRESCSAIPQLLSPLLFHLQLLSDCRTLSQNHPAVPFPNSLPTEIVREKKVMVVILSCEDLMWFVAQ